VDQLLFPVSGWVPAGYDKAKWTDRPDGRRRWPDKLF
jgi:hypothetical protein